MATFFEHLAIESFNRAAAEVPAYRTILAEARIDSKSVRSIEDFRRLPVLDKKGTFGRFPIDQLCVGGSVGKLASVLTSSGHSGLFAFGLSDAAREASAAATIDAGLDMVFKVSRISTLLINCLPMGVKVPTKLCALAETSVRPDMVTAIVRAFGDKFEQIIVVGDAAFVKLALELGLKQGIDWSRHRVHVVLGEETLAENARVYIHHLLGSPVGTLERGLVFSSMGIAEIGLNLFFEVPPTTAMVHLRGVLHRDAALRKLILGYDTAWVPSIFTYDPRRIFVEFVEHDGAIDRMVLTTLDPHQQVPLIRYAPGDHGSFVNLPDAAIPALRAANCEIELLQQIPIVAVQGRGQFVKVGHGRVAPEAIKEGIYADAELCRSTTANLRLRGGGDRATVRLQLAPGVAPEPSLSRRFYNSVASYVSVPIEVVCQRFEEFGSGMNVDYERKFDYLGQ
jgi:phenylacetate-CoA ligase